MPDSVKGDSITISFTYCSFRQDEIDELEAQMPKGLVVMDTDKKAES